MSGPSYPYPPPGRETDYDPRKSYALPPPNETYCTRIRGRDWVEPDYVPNPRQFPTYPGGYRRLYSGLYVATYPWNLNTATKDKLQTRANYEALVDVYHQNYSNEFGPTKPHAASAVLITHYLLRYWSLTSGMGYTNLRRIRGRI